MLSRTESVAATPTEGAFLAAFNGSCCARLLMVYQAQVIFSLPLRGPEIFRPMIGMSDRERPGSAVGLIRAWKIIALLLDQRRDRIRHRV